MRSTVINLLAIKMKKDKIFVFGGLALFIWVSMTYFLFVHRPSMSPESKQRSRIGELYERVEVFEGKLKGNLEQSSDLLNKIKSLSLSETGNGNQDLQKETSGNKSPIKGIEKSSESLVSSSVKYMDPKEVIPVLMFACNRVSVKLALDSLLKARKEDQAAKFPIIVSQDCGHQETADVIKSYGDKIIFIQQPDLSDIEVPANEKKFQGYFKIARHYGWALNETLGRRAYSQVIIVEDDLEVAPDFFEYFEATLPILRADPSLWCVSAWNDNGKTGLIDETKPELLYRTDFFGGLGWLMTRDLWVNELSLKWPRSYWDDWMRLPAQRRDRACIRPEISRTKTFGKIGVSNGLFFDKHLKWIKLNDKFVPFKSSSIDLSYLMKDKYDAAMDKLLNQDTPVASADDVKRGAVSQHSAVRVIYRTKDSFKRIAKTFGIMDDFKSGVPRMAYRGVVATMFRGQRVFVAPSLNWKNYDPSW